MEYKFPLLPIVTDREEAREVAIAWQEWASEQDLSYGELAKWESYFEELAEKFDLKEEFAENCIIGGSES